LLSAKAASFADGPRGNNMMIHTTCILLLPCKEPIDELPKEHDEKPKEDHNELPEFIGDLHLRLPLVQGRLRVCPGIDRCKGGVVGIAGDDHRIAVQAELEGVGPELRGNADVPRGVGPDLGGLCRTAVPECGLEIRTAGKSGELLRRSAGLLGQRS